ncbi:inosamine-phosphate amidinotransferase 1 [Sorangium cellulosum]|uniref:Inosamine-phosphate amidinotransferase 1 n=1 Tax=Sorangium cellulosum TaxID=56 RepID=A0A150TBF9_SORCE|nr:inosamine-phosphate amidinotransferase 1 [Sorangium cellulosum]
MLTNNRISVEVHNEWDPLEEVIVGSAKFAQLPYLDHGMNAIEPGTRHILASPQDRRFPARVIEETEEDLERFIEILDRLGIVVQRPKPIDFPGLVRTPFWESEYYFPYCPRDVLLAIGDTVIESPNPFRSRYFESMAYRDIIVGYLKHGSRWLSAPKPSLRDELYETSNPAQPTLREIEPAFDAANVLRLGRDIVYLVSSTGNELGARWLQSALGPEYRVHPCRDLYCGSHIDTTLAPIRPGLVLINPERVNRDNLPAPLRGWEIIEAPEMEVVRYSDLAPSASIWLGINLLMLSPHLAVVDADQTRLIRLLERHRVEVIPLRLRHGRTLGGGFHCVTLDVRRRGKLESYCE